MGKMLAAKFYWDCYLLQMEARELALKHCKHNTVAVCEKNARESLDLHFDSLENALESIGWARNG
jgi:hypothetical protein